MPRVREDQSVIRESGVSVGMIYDVCHAGLSISLDRPRNIAREHIAASRVNESGIHGNRIARTAEAIASAKGIAHRYAFHAAANAGN